MWNENIKGASIQNTQLKNDSDRSSQSLYEKYFVISFILKQNKKKNLMTDCSFADIFNYIKELLQKKIHIYKIRSSTIALWELSLPQEHPVAVSLYADKSDRTSLSWHCHEADHGSCTKVLHPYTEVKNHTYIYI